MLGSVQGRNSHQKTSTAHLEHWKSKNSHHTDGTVVLCVPPSEVKRVVKAFQQIAHSKGELPQITIKPLQRHGESKARHGDNTRGMLWV